MVKVYLEDMSADARMNVGADVRKIHAAFQMMKVQYHCVWLIRARFTIIHGVM